MKKNPEITLSIQRKMEKCHKGYTITKVTRENPLKTFSSLCQIHELIHQCNLYIFQIKLNYMCCSK